MTVDSQESSDVFERHAINVIRGLAMDAPQAANSGHSGTAMALAPLAHVLFTRVMRYDAKRPEWFNRDRFVLSCGHASILQYSLLYLTGYGLTLDDVKAFRQWESLTPGHPEAGHTAGIEVTTGPLGQGLANSVGLALAEANLRERFGADVSDHYTFCIASDGDLMEGLSHEACSLAGHLGLGRLIVIYDDNHITIDGPTELALGDDAGMRFRSYGWDVDEVGEIAEDLDALERALERAKSVTDRPTLIRLRSRIGFPSPKYTDTSFAHGNPLGVDEIAATKAVLGLENESFHVPDDVVAYYRTAGTRAATMVNEWEDAFAARAGAEPELAACIEGRGLPGWSAALPSWTEVGKLVATRAASGDCLNALVPFVPSLLAGGADLTGNTGTMVKGATPISRSAHGGRLVHYGVREHGMGAIMTGMALHGGIFPVGGTFFVFSDYMRGAVRVAAISGARVVYSWTHDSIGVGEDGPTHQPIEQLMSLRAMPALCLMRPADANEVASAWRAVVAGDGGPVGLVLSRHAIPILPGTAERSSEGVIRGAYVLVDAVGDPDVVLVASGSEVQHCVGAAALLAKQGYAAQVVSMPSWDLFDDQDDDYIDSVFPPEVPVVAVEMGVSLGWERFADIVLGIDSWGASAPSERLIAEYGFTAENVMEAALVVLEADDGDEEVDEDEDEDEDSEDDDSEDNDSEDN